MIITLHTPEGVVHHELTPQELEDLAAEGNLQARTEIAAMEMPQHSDPHLKIDLLAWVLGVTNTKPHIPGP